MSRHGFRLPADFTRDDLAARGVVGADADEVLAFREFLRELNSAGTNETGKKEIEPVWFAYATGEISGAQALQRIGVSA